MTLYKVFVEGRRIATVVDGVSEATEAPATPPGIVWYPERGED